MGQEESGLGLLSRPEPITSLSLAEIYQGWWLGGQIEYSIIKGVIEINLVNLRSIGHFSGFS